MPLYIEKSGVLVGCYHSGTNEQTTEQGKIELLSQWTMDGWDEQYKWQNEGLINPFAIDKRHWWERIRSAGGQSHSLPIMLLLYIAHSDGDYDDHDIVQNERLHRDDDHADADNSIKVKNKEGQTPVQICHNIYIHQKCIFANIFCTVILKRFCLRHCWQLTKTVWKIEKKNKAK